MAVSVQKKPGFFKRLFGGRSSQKAQEVESKSHEVPNADKGRDRSTGFSGTELDDVLVGLDLPEKAATPQSKEEDRSGARPEEASAKPALKSALKTADSKPKKRVGFSSEVEVTTYDKSAGDSASLKDSKIATETHHMRTNEVSAGNTDPTRESSANKVKKGVGFHVATEAEASQINDVKRFESVAGANKDSLFTKQDRVVKDGRGGATREGEGQHNRGGEAFAKARADTLAYDVGTGSREQAEGSMAKAIEQARDVRQILKQASAPETSGPVPTSQARGGVTNEGR